MEEVLGKNLSVPKTHLISHAFVDIKRKGPIPQYTTAFGENGHVRLKDLFPRTSGRDDSFQEEVRFEDSTCSSLLTRHFL